MRSRASGSARWGVRNQSARRRAAVMIRPRLPRRPTGATGAASRTATRPRNRGSSDGVLAQADPVEGHLDGGRALVLGRHHAGRGAPGPRGLSDRARARGPLPPPVAAVGGQRRVPADGRVPRAGGAVGPADLGDQGDADRARVRGEELPVLAQAGVALDRRHRPDQPLAHRRVGEVVHRQGGQHQGDGRAPPGPARPGWASMRSWRPGRRPSAYLVPRGAARSVGRRQVRRERRR